jgi:zinc transport system substrate-binding protein
MIVMKHPASLLAPAALLLLAPLLAACGASDVESGPAPHIVTSFYPLQYVAQRVAGQHGTITNLTHPGVEPHDIALTVRQTAQVVDADVMFYEKGLQAAVDSAVEQNGPDHVVDAAATADLHPAADGNEKGLDPHFWQDPVRLAHVATAFEKELAAVDPDHASAYAKNLASLETDLNALDHDFRTGLAHCAVRTIVVSHDAFGYLADRYGLKVAPINGLSPEAEPSPAHIKQLHQLIDSDGITTVFSESLASPKMADTLASDLGIKAEVLDPIEGLTKATRNQDYLSLMRRNLAALKIANQCT